jgi:hypothetical protein
MSQDECNQVQELLDAQWDGDELSAEDAARVKAHLGACPTCAATAEAMTGLLHRARELSDTRYERAVSVAPLVLRAARRPVLAWGLGLGWVAAALILGVWIGRDAAAPAVPTLAEGSTRVRFVVPVAQASRVEVVGDFTEWKERIPLAATREGLWVGEVELRPGRYNYVIVVDGEQVLADPAAQRQVDDGFGGQNSVLEVGGSI